MKYVDAKGLDWGQWDDGKKTHYHWFNGKVGKYNGHDYGAVPELAKGGSSLSFIDDKGLYVTLRNDPRHYYTAIGGGAPQPVVNPAQDQVNQLGGFVNGVGSALAGLNPAAHMLANALTHQIVGGADETDPGYQNASLISGSLISVAALGIPGPSEAGPAAEGTTTLYRAVSNAEFEQIMRTGTFEQGPNALAGKWFWESAEHAEQFGQIMEGKGGFQVVDAKIPTVQAEKFFRIEHLDNIGPARYGELHELKNAVIGKP